MKTITCRQMGGPCDAKIQGNSADEIIKGGEKHIRDMVAGGDGSHKDAMNMMDEMRKNPAANMEWYEKFKKNFATLPED